ncbi:MAG TPA: amino acid adenylation domain-containing protein, partial [Polyangiaceae bacterium]|nr:amino acid adenylation domain-containing protein [Polyangiaceae bacterium]
RLSFAQERLWFLEQLEPGTGAYNIPSALRLEGKLDVDALRRALREVVRRHETLRTTFGVDPAGLPLPVVHDDAPFELTTRTLDAPPAERDHALFEAGRRAAGAPFDVARGPLVRAELWQIDEDHHALFFTMHHLVSDGWSVGVLVREVTALYLAFTAGRPSPLPDLPIQYADFAAWQREKLSGPELARQLEHWQAELAGAPAALDLPTDRPRPATQSYAGAHFTRPLPPGLLDEVEALGRSLSATPFMLLLAAYAALLARHTGHDDLVIGTPIANRTRVEAEGLIGMFVNTLALRADLRGGPTFAELVARLKARTLAAYAHQDLPFERLVEGLGVSRDPSRPPVFQTMFTLQNTPQETIAVSGLKIAPLAVESGTSQFDLSLDVIPAQSGHLLQWEYNTDLFDRATIERLAAHFEALLGAALASPDAPLDRLPLADAAADRPARAAWNDTAADYPRDQTVHGLFEAQARQTPDATAVEHAGRSLTYAQLDARADALARHLVALGAGPSSIVAVCMARSPDLVATLLAALKANAAYLPIDPSYPPERIAHLLADSGARFVAVDRPDALAGLRPEALAGVTLVCPADVAAPAPPTTSASPAAPDALAATPASPAAPDAPAATPAPTRAAPPGRASDAAYVIYTSGSTGTPKGVVVEHRSVVNYLLSFGRTAGLGASDRLLQFASPSFDVSAEEIFGTLAHGATLVLRTDAMLESVEAFLAAAAELRLSVLDLPTAYWGELTEGLARGARLPAGVRLVVLGGEKARRDVLARWLAATPPGVRLLNAYGPTEATIAATIAELSALPPGDIPIGRPVANARAYVLDAYGEEVPVGVPGELFLGGDCLARGYLRRPALTAERFVPDPFGGAGERLYRTGDRARRLPDGTLEFLGRDDDQVKVRGFRVELGEIEAALTATPSVREAAVVARGEGGARGLFAYVVTDAEGPDANELRRQLRARLPEYMVPSLAVVDALPRSPHGKIDRRALATYETPAGATDSPSFVAPRNEAEAALCAIWQEVLGVERVGVEDDFFALGGSSLLVIRLSVLARERLGLALSVSSIMGRPTVAALAEGSLAGSHLVSFGAGGSAESPPGDAASSREAVVFVHSLSGEAFPYLELAKHLPGYATYGLRSPVADEAVPLATLAELAALHADALAALERPVHLVGWSSGGVIAHEIAHQLDALGCPARSLTLLDPRRRGAKTRRPPTTSPRSSRCSETAPCRARSSAKTTPPRPPPRPSRATWRPPASSWPPRPPITASWPSTSRRASARPRSCSLVASATTSSAGKTSRRRRRGGRRAITTACYAAPTPRPSPDSSSRTSPTPEPQPRHGTRWRSCPRAASG